MLLTNANNVTTKKMNRIDEHEIVKIVNKFLEKHYNLTKIYVNAEAYRKLHIDFVRGVPIYVGSGLQEKEITLVN